MVNIAVRCRRSITKLPGSCIDGSHCIWPATKGLEVGANAGKLKWYRKSKLGPPRGLKMISTNLSQSAKPHALSLLLSPFLTPGDDISPTSISYIWPLSFCPKVFVLFSCTTTHHARKRPRGALKTISRSLESSPMFGMQAVLSVISITIPFKTRKD
jgi:hypothetical protein